MYSVSLSRSPTDRPVVQGSVILTFFISLPPFSMTSRYAVIGLPPSSAGGVHLTVSEVARMSPLDDMMVGELGFSGKSDNDPAF